MQLTKQKYRQFLTDNFKGLRLRKPLFYSWDLGLRFDLQVGKTGTDEYFQEVIRRASTIFQSAFDNSDELLLVFMDYRYKRSKIRFSNFLFRQIDNLQKSEIVYSKELRLYELYDKFDIRNIAIIKLITERIDYKTILNAIGNTDFPSRHPRLDQNGFLTGKEVYFINIDKKLIFHMYDDRGIDIISKNIETLLPFYQHHNDWILEYDRERIDRQFEKQITENRQPAI